MVLVWAKFLVCVLIIGIAGTYLSKYGDAIAEKTGLGGLWIGVVLLAAATSMPELFTGIGSVAIVGVPDLAIGDVFGANCWDLVNLALLDALSRGSPLLTRASTRQVLSASLIAVAVAVTAASIIIGNKLSSLSLGWIGVYSPVLFILYLVSMMMIFRFERQSQQDNLTQELKYQQMSEMRAYLGYAISALVIIGAGTWLATIGDEITVATGWGASFVGSLFLGFCTTIPEIVVSYTALRLGAVDMAVSNLLGSCLFNIAFVIPVVDLFWQGPIFSSVSESHIFTGFQVIVMTSIVIASLIYQPKRKTPIGISWSSVALIVVFVLGFYTLFTMGARPG